MGDVTAISSGTYASLVTNLKADWSSKGFQLPLQIDRIQLMSNGYRQSSFTYYGQEIVWDDLQLLYTP